MTDTPRYPGKQLDEFDEDRERASDYWDADDKFWDRVDRLVDFGGSPGAAVEKALLEEKAA